MFVSMVVLVGFQWVVSLPKRGKALGENTPRLGLGIKKPGTVAGFGNEKGPISRDWAMLGKS
jgi:hypothetical protein